MSEDHRNAEAMPEREPDEALMRAEESPDPARLLSFYDRLRERMLRYVERRGGRLGERGAKALLLVPDVFMLLVRLVLDPQVPHGSRALIGGALTYFLLPFDLLPEAVLGAAGFVDDLVLAVAVLASAFGRDLEPYARRHWSGSQDLREVLGEVTGVARGLLGETLFERVRRLLARRGVVLEDPRPPRPM